MKHNILLLLNFLPCNEFLFCRIFLSLYQNFFLILVIKYPGKWGDILKGKIEGQREREENIKGNKRERKKKDYGRGCHIFHFLWISFPVEYWISLSVLNYLPFIISPFLYWIFSPLFVVKYLNWSFFPVFCLPFIYFPSL